MVDCEGLGQLITLDELVVPERLVIATRESRLAWWQAEHVRGRLQSLYPHCEVTLLGMTTTGDQILDRSLVEVGGKGLFTKELEQALLDGRADLAVHSLKDVPMVLAPTFDLACIMAREDPRDALVSTRFSSLAALPTGARVGTASLRRAAQLAAQRPDLRIGPLRGNLDTRLCRLDEGQWDAIVLAVAGLVRLGAQARIRQYLPVSMCVPAPGQGALGLEIAAHRSELRAVLAPLQDASTCLAVTAERAFSRVLEGSCRVALAAHAQFDATGWCDFQAFYVHDGRVQKAAMRECCPLEGVVRASTGPLTEADLAWATDLGERAVRALQ